MTSIPYLSGFCSLGGRAHGRCVGFYAGVACTCGCHDPAPPGPCPLCFDVGWYLGSPCGICFPAPARAEVTA